MNFNEMSIEQKNVLITEKLFGLKVIYPKEYFAKLKGKNADYYRSAYAHVTNDPVYVKGNKPLKTHYLDSMPAPNFYNGARAYDLIAQARVLIEGKGLHEEFAYVLRQSIINNIGLQDRDIFALVNALPSEQADAIVKVLLEQK